MGREQGWFKLALAVVGVAFGALSSGCIACGGDSSDNGNASACDPGPSGGTGGMAGSGSLNLGGSSSADGGRAGAPVSSCNEFELQDEATPVTVTATEEAAPEPTGGAIANGTYFYSAEIIYESAAAAPMTFPASQISVSGSGWQEAIAFESGVARRTRELETVGSEFTLTTTCPAGGSVETGTYTATDTSITFYSEGGLNVVGRVYTKQ